MPAPSTLLPTKKSSSKGLVLTTKGGLGFRQSGALEPIFEERLLVGEYHNATGPWPLALGVSGGWENQVDVRLSWGFLLLPRPQICCSARFSRAAAVVQGVLKNTAVFTTGWDIFFF